MTGHSPSLYKRRLEADMETAAELTGLLFDLRGTTPHPDRLKPAAKRRETLVKKSQT